MLDLGLPEMLDEGGVTVIEWGDADHPGAARRLPRDPLLRSPRTTTTTRIARARARVGPALGRPATRGRRRPRVAPVDPGGRRRADPRHRHRHRAGELRHRRPRGRAGVDAVGRGRRHAEILTPSIEFICRQARIELSEISVVAVDLGPGLFTGLRVGVAAAKAMAHALRVPMIGVPSLDLLAFPVRFSSRLIVAAIDARRGELFYAFYRQVPGGMQRLSDHRVGSPDDLASRAAGHRARSACSSATARIRYREVFDGLEQGRDRRARSWPTRRPRRW